MKNIVILGGSYAGLSTAHRILKQSSKLGPFKITLVSPDTDLYWNIASARGIVPGQFSDDKLFQPIATGFDKYPASQFEFILAAAESLDVDAKKVELSGQQMLDYDFLILATGSRTKDGTPLKGMGSTEATKDTLHKFQAQIKKAKTIVLAGGGVTSIELAGEVAYEYGRQKEVILIASGKTVTPGSAPALSKYALKALRDLKVDIRLQTKVTSSSQTPNGGHELTLSSSDKLMTDMYIPLFGVIPNSSYVPAKFLDTNGYVVVDEYLKVKGAGDVWALGDVSNVEPARWIYCEKHSKYAAETFASILTGKTPLPYKLSKTPLEGFQIGKKAAIAAFGNFRIPSFVVVRIRKTLFTENLGPTVDGSLF